MRALLVLEDTTGASRRALALGTGYGALLWLSSVVHTLGHVFAARLAGTPADAVLLTSTRDGMTYRGWKREVAEPGAAARRLGIFGVFNLAVALWTLAPIPTRDGWILWRWVFLRRKGSR